VDQKSTPKNYRYLDGSGNEYKFNNKFIEYIPIKPFYSSSGVYDGGDHIKKDIKEFQFNQLSSILNTAMENKKIHITDRVKRSGIIIIQDKNKQKTCILNPNSKEVQNIEKMLHEIISNC